MKPIFFEHHRGWRRELKAVYLPPELQHSGDFDSLAVKVLTLEHAGGGPLCWQLVEFQAQAKSAPEIPNAWLNRHNGTLRLKVTTKDGSPRTWQQVPSKPWAVWLRHPLTSVGLAFFIVAAVLWPASVFWAATQETAGQPIQYGYRTHHGLQLEWRPKPDSRRQPSMILIEDDNGNWTPYMPIRPAQETAQ